MSIDQSNNYRKDLSRLHFDDELSDQMRQRVKDQQYYLFVFVAYLTISSRSQEDHSKQDNSILCMGVWQISGERNFQEQIKAPIFLETFLAMVIMKETQSNYKCPNPNGISIQFNSLLSHSFKKDHFHKMYQPYSERIGENVHSLHKK